MNEFDIIARDTEEVVREYVEESRHAGGFVQGGMTADELATDILEYGRQTGHIMDIGVLCEMVERLN